MACIFQQIEDNESKKERLETHYLIKENLRELHQKVLLENSRLIMW